MTNGNNTAGNNGTEEPQLSRGFKFRVAMTIIFFILALVYILWLIKLL